MACLHSTEETMCTVHSEASILCLHLVIEGCLMYLWNDHGQSEEACSWLTRVGNMYDAV